MKKLFSLLLVAFFATGCYSDYDKFETLKQKFPHCEILSRGEFYYAVDTTSLHGAIYYISFWYGNKIANVDRIR
jgi:hypothetical protein